MLYDESISQDISLSRILDVMISSNEKIDVIVTFLKTHEDKFKDIILNSSYSSRLFQFDFYLKLSYIEQKWFIKKLYSDTPYWLASLCVWQILRYSVLTKTSNRLSNKFEFHIIVQDNNYRHPYRNGEEKYIVDFDNLCFEYAKNSCISLIPYDVNTTKLVKVFKHLRNSLFVTRIFQADFFSNLSITGKWSFIHEGLDCAMHGKLDCALMHGKIIQDFLSQIIESDEELDIKLDIIKTLKQNNDFKYIFDQKIKKLVDECDSFSEMLLKLTMFPQVKIQSIILYLLLCKPNWLKEWTNFDVQDLDNKLTCSYIVEKL